MKIHFTIPGAPQGKARARTVKNKYTGKTHSYTPSKTAAYEDFIAAAYKQQAAGKSFGACPVIMYIDAYFPIPKSFRKKEKAEAATGEILPTTKPDADNIAKAICDALNGVAFDDDKQIIYLCVKKAYSNAPRVEVIVQAWSCTQGKELDNER